MRSIYIKILLWCFGSLAVCIAAWGFVSSYVFYQMVGKDSFFERMNALQLKEAEEVYESQGPTRLKAHFERVNTLLGGYRYLTDAHGKDLVTGEDRSELLARFQARWGVLQTHGDQIAVALASADDRYRLLVLADSPFNMRQYIPYYVPILLVLAILCWLLAWRIASPLQSLVSTLDRFGRGDLTARVNSTRRDEIGELGAAFDRMAERIGTLLTSERRLLQDVSHELRSPLARLSFAAELAGTAENRGAAVTRLKKEIQRLTDLVDALLQTMQAGGEPHAISEEDLNLSSLLNEIVEDCRLEAEARTCRVSLHGESTTIQGERELLRRAFENVVRNAIRYSPQDSTIDVTFGVDDHMAHISVRDYGTGVPQDSLAKIFEPFFRVDDSRNRSTGGVGLGLAIAHRSIISHDGRIWAENAYPGLIVRIELPLLVYKT
jgi:two-component system sensor histidine kinase CpxA